MTNKPKIYFSSDLHFGHRNILQFTNPRPFATIDEHDEAIIANWNKVVKPGDVVYILGDLSLRGSIEMLRDRLSRLNGSLHIILGNHDKSKVLAQLLNENILQSMRDMHNVTVDVDGEKWFLKLCHFPILEFDGAYRKNTMHLYGHIHNITNYDDIYQKLGFKALHVGLDTSHLFPNTAAYSPIALEDIIARADEMFGRDCADSLPRHRGAAKVELIEHQLYKLSNGHYIRLSRNEQGAEYPWHGIILDVQSSYDCYLDFDADGRASTGTTEISKRI